MASAPSPSMAMSRPLPFLAGCPLRGASSPLARAAFPAGFLLGLVLTAVLGASSPVSTSPLPGSSTTKRYLHFGQSTFFPIRLGSLIGTMPSQLGHGTLN